MEISSRNVGEERSIVIDVSKVRNSPELGFAYYSVVSKTQLGGDVEFTVENAAKYRNFLNNNDRYSLLETHDEEYIILFYDNNYKVLYYYKGNTSD